MARTTPKKPADSPETPAAAVESVEAAEAGEGAPVRPGRRAFTLRAQADGKTVELWLYDVIDDSDFWGGITAKQIAQELKPHRDATTIVLNINSAGGSAFGGMAIYNVLHRHAARKVVNIDGMALSAASVVAMVGDEIHMAENAMMMIHEAWTIAIGDSEEMTKTAEMLDKINETLRLTYAARTGRTEDQVADWMAAETWFTAEEAKANGFATAITPAKKAAALARAASAAVRFGYRHIPEDLAALIGSAERTPMPGDAHSPALTEELDAMNPDKTKKAGDGTDAPQDAPQPAATPSKASGAPADGGDRETIATATLKDDRERRTAIMALVEKGLDRGAAQRWCDEGVTVAEATRLTRLAADMSPLAVTPGSRVEVGADRNLASLPAAMEDALCLRVGVPLLEFDAGGALVRDEAGRPKTRKPHERAMRFRALSIPDMACQFLLAAGVPDATMLARDQAIQIAMNPREQITRGVPVAFAMSTGDFPNILAGTVNRSLRAEYELAAVSWPIFCQRETNPDFKDRAITALSEAPELLETAEGGTVRFATFVENGRTIRVVKFMRGIRLTREMMANDDLGAFRRIPRAYGQRAKGKEDDVAYAPVTANGTIDGGALFNTTAVTTAGGHANLAGSGAALSVDTLNAGFAAMGLQRGMKTAQDGDAGPAFLNLTPTVLLVPVTQRGKALALVDLKDPLSPNIYKGRLRVEANARLDANSTTAWYLAAPVDPPADVIGAPRGVDTITVCFLESQQAPVTRQDQNLKTLDIEIVCEHIVAAAVIDWRGWYKNAGG